MLRYVPSVGFLTFMFWRTLWSLLLGHDKVWIVIEAAVYMALAWFFFYIGGRR
jgi:hypothetical protein